MKISSLLLAAALGLATLATSTAQTILVDFGPAGNPTASPDVNGNYWNNLFAPAASSSIANLTTTTNTLSGITLTITTGFGASGPSETPPALTGESSLGNLNISTALSDFFFVNNSTAVITFSNLDPTKIYTFSLLGSRDAAAVRNTTYTLTGGNSGFTTVQTSGSNLGGAGINYNDSTLGVVSSITPNGSNSITLSVNSSGLGYLNALQISVVPEPAAAALSLGGLGVLLLLKRSRSRRI